jgi:pimeloyl-ACP methyl ester carboxylesterase
VTLIEGDLSDPAFVRADEFVMHLLPQARKVSLPGSAHMLHIDQPDAWVQIVT